jgi:hypothetical protein
MTGENWESMLARFRAFGAAPSVAGYLDLFDPDGAVQHPGMPRPLRAAAIGEFIEGALAAIPDFTLTPLRWCARDNLLFVEARCTGTVGDRPVAWPALYRLITRAGRVLDGRAFYDRAAVLAHTDAALTARRDEPHATMLDNLIADTAPAVHVDDPRVVSEFLQRYANTWSDPRSERFAPFYLPGATMIEPLMRHPITYPEITAHYRTLLSELPDPRLHLRQWAYRPGVLFAEWTAVATVNRQPVRIARTDCFLLAGTRVRERAGYLDSLSIPTADNARFTDSTVFATS